MKNFDVIQAPVKGVNLVEASAGTGKTYSVGIMVLRCLLEQGVPIAKILMVTFTKAAVAELEERVRKYVNNAHSYAFGLNKFLPEGQDTISDVVQRSVKSDADKTKKALAKALSQLDELSVMTIHSFCEKNLKEFAFASGQMFQQDIIADESELIAKFAAEYWQNLLCGDDKDIIINNTEVKYSDFKSAVKSYLNGIELVATDERPDFLEDIKTLQELLNDNSQLGILKQYQIDNNAFGNNTIAKVDISNAWNLLLFCLSKIDAKYIKEIPNPFGEIIHRILNPNFLEIPAYIYKKGLKSIAEKLQKHKIDRALLSYDDLITKMYEAVHHSSMGNDFIENVSRNYWAVFIDEFQDTDEKQYHIFQKIFAKNSRVLYYIGDPKQSIYGWRSADLDVYDKAKKSVPDQNQFTMGTNFRSEQVYVSTLNHLYHEVGENDFKRELLRYKEMQASNTNQDFVHPDGETRLNFFEDDANKLARQMALKIKELLNNKAYSIKGRAIVASDIGVLVRKGKDANAIKSQLEFEGIPSILRDGKSIFESDEALFLQRILQAIDAVNAKNIGAALVGPYFGLQSKDWPSRNTEPDVLFFKTLQLEFAELGVFPSINKALAHYHFYEQVQSLGAGDRMQSNVQQINELLHAQQNNGASDAKDFIQYLQRERSGVFTSAGGEDLREKRIESDENAVQISTIHKAKGLQYNIVLALTHFDNTLSPYRSFFSYKNPNTAQKLERLRLNAAKVSLLTPDENEAYQQAVAWHKAQMHEENLRMIYVMFTRAVYATYLFGKEKDKGSFTAFENVIKNTSFKEGICPSFDIRNVTLEKSNTEKQAVISSNGLRSTDGINAFGSSYYRQSYSSLSGGAFHPVERTEGLHVEKLSDYDKFIFHSFPRGAQAGTFLHEMFENTNFKDKNSWTYAISKICKKYGATFEKEGIKEKLNELIQHTVEADLGNNLSLEKVSNDGKINEMEFFLTTQDWDVMNKPAIQSHFGERLSLNGNKIPDGFLNGFIDLIFEHEGKYYILDWKSNDLGNSLSNYTHERLDEAMTNSNYHLQYLIYSVALHRYLKLVLGDSFNYDQHMGGVYYLFLRGLRSGKPSGVFYNFIPETVLVEFEKQNLILNYKPQN